MEKKILWDKGFLSQCCITSLDKLNEYLQLLQFFQDNDIEDYIVEKVIEDERLWEWIYSKEIIELIDVKKELSKKIQKLKTLNEVVFEEDIINLGQNKQPRIFLCSFSKKNVFCISSIPEYYIALRNYLSMEKKNEFCKDLKESFPEIFFTEDIEASVNSLNRRFEEIRVEIVHHLTELSQYRLRFLELLEENNSYTDIAQIFTQETGIECSPQSSRDHIENLKMECENSITGENEIVKCELHTKFKTFNINRLKQDRIYFFPGKKGVKNERVIVKHIGKHL